MATAARSVRGKHRKSGSSWAAWIPLALGIVMTPVALRAASILALSGTGGLMLLYPFVQIVQNPALQVPGAFADSLAQWIMYLQFPLYGLLMARIIKSKGLWIALNVVVFLHAAGVGLAYLLAHFQNPYLRL
ncbi:MAG: hypothetical protein WBD10_11315 [Acidobacteriaceae bacterium]